MKIASKNTDNRSLSRVRNPWFEDNPYGRTPIDPEVGAFLAWASRTRTDLSELDAEFLEGDAA